MPGFLGGGSSSGASGELKFSKEFIDPVTKLRVSEPENLIDTDFEYGLQPTKWETVELINNTPSFFSKSGDTTIDGIISITTNAGTREITVTTALEHGLAAGIPIQVTGTKSTTADGSYIINSIPNTTTFTYLCKDNQLTTASIEDLYSSIITGEFFQGSQLRISDDAGIVTDGGAYSTLTVTTDSTHGFGINTPFYFLNLNSTISQEFQAANTASKAFDASNSATAQTFDGSNTLSSINIDFSNSAVVGGVTSSISSTNPASDTITVTHGTENFAGKPIGTPLYYDVVAGSGYFNANPRGVVFIKDISGLGTLLSAFTVSEIPDGPVIDVTGSMTGTFQLANQARTFAGNNVGANQQVVTIINDTPQVFDGTNTAGTAGQLFGFSGSSITLYSTTPLNWYFGTMLLYAANGDPATGLSDGVTYFVDSFSRQGTTDYYTVTVKPLPNGTVISSLANTNQTGTLKQIGISLDKDIIHIKDNGFVVNDMLRYDYPVAGNFSSDQVKNFYFVQTKYDAHNFTLSHTLGEISPLTQSRTGTNAGTAITPTEMTVIGFQTPYSFAVTSGTLPAGLTLNTSTGVVSGTPSAAYTQANVSITLTDSSGAQATSVITFQFNPRPNLYDFTSATFTSGGASGADGPNISQARSGVGNPAWASTYLTMTTNGIQLWTVPETATYRVIARGANGKPATNNGSNAQGGQGIIANGTCSLTQGEVIRIVVGQQGIASATNGGGGGATYVVRSSATNEANIIVIAGGGGGRREASSGVGVNATSATNGLRTSSAGDSTASGVTSNLGTNSNFPNNVTLGNGGSSTSSGYGDGGGGFYGNGFDDGSGGGDGGGKGFSNGARGGTTSDGSNGGFGGGGSGQGGNGGGGGGGYTGGNGGHTAGGGGSYSNLTGVVWSYDGSITTGSSGNFPGYVTIQKI